jgi:hypothetical protein
VSYLKLSRYALLAGILVWALAMILGGLLGMAGEASYLAGIVSSVLIGLLAANALVAQVLLRLRNGKAVKNG